MDLDGHLLQTNNYCLDSEDIRGLHLVITNVLCLNLLNMHNNRQAWKQKNKQTKKSEQLIE